LIGIAMKRFFLWLAGVLLAGILIAGLAATFSPWPAVAVITYAFAKGDAASNAALAKHVPAGIVSQLDVAYGASKDEVFDLYRPQGAGVLPAIVWVHGGGYVAGSKEGVANYLKIFAGNGYAAIAVEYSRGRGANYPKALEQVNAALGFISAHAADLHVDASAIALGGDSAGAHIASQVALIVTNPDYAKAIGIAPRVKPQQMMAMLLMSGTFDPFRVDRDGGRAWFGKRMMWAYTGVKHLSTDPRFALMSVPAHVTAAFPPSFISSGNADSLAPQAVALADRLRAIGVPTEVLFFPEDHQPPLRHQFQFNLDSAEGQESLQRMLAFLRSRQE
jgi:acetyl esterase/lipase